MIVVPGLLEPFHYAETHRWAFCYRIERETDGEVFRYTNADHEMQGVMTSGDWSSPTFEDFTPADGPSSESWERNIGTNESTGAIFGTLSSSNLNAEDFRLGLFDNAKCDVYMIDTRRPWAGAYLHERYWFGDIEYSGSRYRIVLESLVSRVNKKIGRQFYKNCDAQLGDNRCGKDISLLQEVGTVVSVTAGKEKFRFISNATTQPNHYYDLGYVLWQTGNNAITGANRQPVRKYLNSGEVYLFTPTPYNIEPADQFLIVVGCGHEFHKDCRKKFGNKENFRGFPHLKGVDKFIGAPSAKS